MLFGDIIGEFGEEEFLREEEEEERPTKLIKAINISSYLELGEFIESSLISSLVLSELDICDSGCTMTGC